MKIFFLIRSLDIGGSQRQLVILATELAKRGHDVAIIVSYAGGAGEQCLTGSKVRLLSLEKKQRWDFTPLLRLRRLLKSEVPDVLYAFLPAETATAALLLPRHLKTKLVFGVRATAMDHTRYDFLSRLLYRAESLLSKRADLVIANGNTVRADAIARGLPANRTVVVSNGIDTDQMQPDAESGRKLRERWGISQGGFLIGMVARLDPMKDHANFLRAASIFMEKDKNARFVCVGDGAEAYRGELRRMAQSFGISDQVIWAGDRVAIKDAFNAFDIATLSSAFGEGFSNVVGEAMACGIPVAATDVGDNRLVIEECGEVVPPHNPELLSAAWSRLAERLRNSDGLRAAARQRIVNHFSVERMVVSSERFIESLTKPGH